MTAHAEFSAEDVRVRVEGGDVVVRFADVCALRFDSFAGALNFFSLGWGRTRDAEVAEAERLAAKREHPAGTGTL